LACWLHIQEEERGSVYHDTELWLERVLQWLKSKVKYHTTSCPEKIMANFVLLDLALRGLRGNDDQLKSFDDWIPAYRSRELTGEQYDDDYGADDRMLFAGLPPAGANGNQSRHGLQWERDIKPVAMSVVEDANAQGLLEWQPEDLDTEVPGLKVGTICDSVDRHAD
jgi:hypothetical protein